jgi:hypothetical protein
MLMQNPISVGSYTLLKRFVSVVGIVVSVVGLFSPGFVGMHAQDRLGISSSSY